MGFFSFTQEIAIDLGTANSIIVYNDQIVVDEPSVVALDKRTDRLIAVGERARQMQGKENESIRTIRPLRDGVIADFYAAEMMIRGLIKMIPSKNRFFTPSLKMVVGIPSGSTEVEMRAVRDSSEHAGGREIYMIYEPMAAALGIGIDVEAPDGCMVVDIGGGTTDIAVISLGGTVVSSSIKMAGDKFDEAIVRYMRKKHNIMIGERSAEELKISIGTVFPRPQEVYMDVRGRNLVSGLPKTITVSSSELMEALEEPVSTIVEAVHSVLERTPPELAADISDRGIVMTGGGSLVYGLDKLLQQKTGINVLIADDAVSCVAVGTGKTLDNLDLLKGNTLSDGINYSY